MSTTLDIEQVRTEAETELADARERRERLSLDALSGNEAAAADLVQVEARIAELERAIVLASLATSEKSRRDRLADEEAERKRRAQARREAEKAAAQRQQALDEARAALGTLSATVARFLEAEAVHQDACLRAGERHVALAEPFGELVVDSLRNAGIPGSAFVEWQPAAYRKRLRERFGELPPSDDAAAPAAPEVDRGEVAAAVAACTVCAHDNRAAIEADLAAGVTLREIEVRHGVSRSALSRHKRHNETSESEAGA